MSGNRKEWNVSAGKNRLGCVFFCKKKEKKESLTRAREGSLILSTLTFTHVELLRKEKARKSSTDLS